MRLKDTGLTSQDIKDKVNKYIIKETGKRPCSDRGGYFKGIWYSDCK